MASCGVDFQKFQLWIDRCAILDLALLPVHRSGDVHVAKIQKMLPLQGFDVVPNRQNENCRQFGARGNKNA